MANKKFSLADLAALARKGKKVTGGTEVASATSRDTLAGPGATGGTTAGREQMGDPAKPKPAPEKSVLAKLAAKGKNKADEKEKK